MLARSSRVVPAVWRPGLATRAPFHRIGAICAPFTRKGSSASGGGKLEFTLAPYKDVPDLGYKRSDKFCMLTLCYPPFQTGSPDERQALYEQKKQRRAAYIDELFDFFDDDQAGSLDRTQLVKALKSIGLPADDGAVAGILQRKDEGGTGTITRTEFPKVVQEAWGQVPVTNFSNRLGELHAEEPLDGERALSFLGRTSPSGWVLRAVRNMWPYAVKDCVILRNASDNPGMDPALMEIWMEDYEHGPVMYVEHVAQEAAKQAPTAKGGFVVRVVPVDPPADGDGMLHIPFRGLPENGKKGLLSWLGF
eukprot:gb/GFBE01001129.1/.p1 GENE.gb/GFBE01001129.1/~~gb/GFBE01001129.1/.p1  ORF type:complete len:307 (+),score=38.74 gb/GFBE01001129.1/:1-921(+)